MYITITGGGFANQGAAAMTRAAIRYARAVYPEDQILVFGQKSQAEREGEGFSTIRDDFFVRTSLCCPWSGIAMKHRVDLEARRTMRHIFENTRLNLDVSGYALGSNWKNINSVVFLMRIYTGKKFGFPVYVLPQSFGPFQYRGIQGAIIMRMIKQILQYPRVVYARERQGYELLRSVGLRNVRRCPDLVLTSPEDRERVEVQVKQPAAAIIPNVRNLDYVSEEQMLAIYQRIGACLLKEGFHIYLLTHSAEDAALCRKLAEAIPSVEYIEGSWSGGQMLSLLSRFQLAVVSRYHALVHAYKERLPCLVIGWAEKYRELMQYFGQEKYYLDIRPQPQNTAWEQSLSRLITRRKDEREIITAEGKRLEKSSVFDEITEDYREYSRCRSRSSGKNRS